MPGSPAAGAGIRAGDVVVAVGGTRLAGYADPGAAIAEQMRGVRVGQRVSLEILRDGRAIGFEVVAQAGPSAAGAPSWLGAPGLVPGADGVPAAPAVPSAPAAPRAPGGAVLQPAIDGLAAGDPGTAVGPGPGDRLELADLSSQTQPRSGAQGGVLVVRAPRVPGWNLEDGDIIVAIDGRRPADVQHAARILRSYRGGETLQLTIVRRGQTRTLAVRLPEPRRVV
jgi:S1-C subfamily serine protease